MTLRKPNTVLSVFYSDIIQRQYSLCLNDITFIFKLCVCNVRSFHSWSMCVVEIVATPDFVWTTSEN